MQQTSQKAPSRTTTRRRHTAICCSYCSRNPSISHTCAALSPWLRLTNCYRQSCSPSTETNMRVGKSICCSQCSRLVDVFGLAQCAKSRFLLTIFPIVRLDVSIRSHFRLLIPSSCKHSCVPHYDDVHQKRPWSKLPQNCPF